jgi:poly(3-hydroxybutyrate) depolymerase|tara:strand:+ start:14929 stop:18066 length:3138 start_codon:yes stop_codon:yes gene_type:complete
MAEDYSQIEKSISFFINQQFPAIYREDGPELVQLARDYYKWMETATNQSTYVSRRFFEYKDVDTTIKSLLIFYKNKYLVDLELKESIVPFLVKNILDLYRRKGTKAGIELFFATFYKEYDIEIVYPSNRMLKASNSEWKEGNFLQMLPNDNLFLSDTTSIQYTYADLISRVITGSVSQAKASVAKINSMLINGRYTPIIYIDNVQGTFLKYDRIYTNISKESIDFGEVGGSLSEFIVDDTLPRLANKKIGDSVKIQPDSFEGDGGEGIVTDVTNAVNAVATYNYINGGYGYSVANTSLLVSNQAINTDPSNEVQFELYERLEDADGNEGYVLGQSDYNIGVKMTTGTFDHARPILTVDRNPNIDLKANGIQIGVSPFNNSSPVQLPAVLYPEGNPPDANTDVYAVISDTETVNLITDPIQPYLGIALDAADYGAITPMSGTASPVTLSTVLADAFDTSGIEIGKLDLFENVNPGSNYGFEIFARAKDDLITKFEKRGQVIRLSNIQDAALFNVNESITEETTLATASILRIDSVQGLLYILPNSWNGFTGINNIIRSNNDVFTIAGASTDYSSRFYGDNAIINARADFETGYINKVAINNSGFSYVNGDTGTLRDPIDTSIVLASGTIEAQEQGKNKGYWKDYSSHINGYVTQAANSAAIDTYYNSGMRIQDSDFYQEYSYQIKSTLDKSQYEKLLKENVHLAGSKMFGDFIYKYGNTGKTKQRFIRLFNDEGSGSPLDVADIADLRASVTNFSVDSTYVTADHTPGGTGGANLSESSDLTITKNWSQGFHDYEVTIGMPSTGSAPYPTAILLHGNGGNGAAMVTQFGNELQGHILVGVQGYANSWNISNEGSNGPDIEMLEELITNLKLFQNVDETKIRIIGISNGGGLALRAAVEIEDTGVDTIACIISQTTNDQYRGGQFYYPSNHEQTGNAYSNDGYDTLVTSLPQRKILHLNGRLDTTVPYTGGNFVGQTFLSAPNSALAFAKSQGYNGNLLSGSAYGSASTLVDYGNTIFLNDNVAHTVSTDMFRLLEKYLENDYDISY